MCAASHHRCCCVRIHAAEGIRSAAAAAERICDYIVLPRLTAISLRPRRTTAPEKLASLRRVAYGE